MWWWCFPEALPGAMSLRKKLHTTTSKADTQLSQITSDKTGKWDWATGQPTQEIKDARDAIMQKVKDDNCWDFLNGDLTELKNTMSEEDFIQTAGIFCALSKPVDELHKTLNVLMKRHKIKK